MKHLSFRALWGVLFSCLLLGATAPARAADNLPVLYTASHVDPCPGASVCAKFTGAQGYKAGGQITRNFASLPGLTVTRSTGGYAENLDGSLTQFASGVARITGKGLLVEQASTNLMLWSQDYSGGHWAPSFVTVAANAGIAPDGTNTANLIQAQSGFHTESLFGPSVSFTSGTTYALSAYVKMGTYRYVEVRPTGGAFTSTYAIFDLMTGQATISGNVVSVSSYPAGNGWYRVVLIATANTTNAATGLGFVFATGPTAAYDAPVTATGTETFYAWGAQVEALPFPTSYIPTTSASATRAADFIALAGVNAVNGGTLYAKWISTNTGIVNPGVASLNDGTGNNKLDLRDSQGSVKSLTTVAGAAQSGATATPAVPGGGITRAAAYTWGASRALYVDGVTQVTASATSYPTTTQLQLGGLDGVPGSITQLNGYIQAAAVYPTIVANAQALTSGTDLTSLSLDFARGLYKTTTPYVRTNLITNSTSFSTSGGSSLVGFVTAPDGTTTASRFDLTPVVGSQEVVRSSSATVSPSQTYTGSLYVRAPAGTQLSFQTKRFIGATIASTSTGNLTMTGTWQRIPTITVTMAADSTAGGVSVFSALSNTAPWVEVWGAQLEPGGSYSTSLIPTTGSSLSVATTQSTNPADVGQFTFTRAAGKYAPDSTGKLVWFASGVPAITDLGISIEGAATNLLLQSQALSLSSWTGATSVDENISAAPDGTLTADRVNIASAGGFLQQSITTTVNVGDVYTLSGWARNASPGMQFRAARFGAGTFEVTAVPLPTGSTWTRVSTTITFANAQTGVRADVFATNANSSVEVWGLQLEKASFASSYIPTTTASATRPADVAWYGGLNVAWPMSIGGSANFTGLASGAQQFLAQLDDGTTANRVTLQSSNSATSASVTASGSVTQANISAGSTMLPGVLYNMATRVASNDVKIAGNGALGGSSTTATLPAANATRLQIGQGNSLSNQLNGFLSKVTLYPYAASDGELSYRSSGNW